MLIKKPDDIPAGEITDAHAYFNRRSFMRLGLLGASALATGWAYRKFNASPRRSGLERPWASRPIPAVRTALSKSLGTDEEKTSFDGITHYNNFL